MRSLITSFLLVFAVASNASCQEKNITPIKTERNKTLVAVKVGNVVIPNIIFDTGLAYDALMIYNTAYLDSLNLSGGVVVYVGGAGPGSTQTALMVESSEFSIGNTVIKNQPLIVLQSDIFKGFPTNGVIGYSVFGHYVTEFDYDYNTLTLYEKNEKIIDESWTPVPIYFKDNNIPWLDAEVVIDKNEPVKLSMYIDFAAGDPVLLLEKPRMKFPYPEETEDYYIGRGLSGDIYGKKCTVTKLIIGKYELNSVTAFIADEGVRSKQKNADAILGNGSLMRFNLIFDYENKFLYIKPNSHFNDKF